MKLCSGQESRNRRTHRQSDDYIPPLWSTQMGDGGCRTIGNVVICSVLFMFSWCNVLSRSCRFWKCLYLGTANDKTLISYDDNNLSYNKKNQEVCSLLSGNKNVKEKCPKSIHIPGNKQPSLILAPREDVTDFCFTLNLPEVSCLAKWPMMQY